MLSIGSSSLSAMASWTFVDCSCRISVELTGSSKEWEEDIVGVVLERTLNVSS